MGWPRSTFRKMCSILAVILAKPPKYSTQDFPSHPHGILGRSSVFPLLIPLIAALLLRLWRGRSARYAAAATGLLTMAGLLVAGSGSVQLSLWQPTELFGDGVFLRMDATVLPYALLAAAILTHRTRIGELELLHLAAVLVAIAAGNLLALVVSWSLLAAWSNWQDRNIWHLAAVAPLFAAAAVGSDAPGALPAGPFLALAALLRGRGADRPYLAALPALAVLARPMDGGPLLVLLGAAAIVVGTLGGRRWLAAGVLGIAAVSAGMNPTLATAAALASAVTLVAAGSSAWAPGSVRTVVSGVLVGSLPLQISLLVGSGDIPLLLIPAAALLAAPVLSGAGRLRGRSAPTITERLAAAWPMAVGLLILLLAAERFVPAGALYGVAAVGLGALMAAGPRWLYRQPAYVRLAENLFRTLGAQVVDLFRSLAVAVRGLNNVLEGEASTVWLFVILLIVVQGLAG